MPLKLGTRVLSRFGGGEQEFPGTISASYSDNTYGIDYDDGDTEDRVARNFIRILVIEEEENEKENNMIQQKQYQETLLLYEKSKEENIKLKHEIKQLSSLIEEEDSETEKLMLTLNASLTESRRVQTEKDEELKKAFLEIEELKKRQKVLQQQQNVSKGPSTAALNKQIDDLKKDLKKAQEAEAAARRAHQQTKKEIKLSSDQLVQSLTDQIKELRDEHANQMNELEKQVEMANLSLQEGQDQWEKEKITLFEKQQENKDYEKDEKDTDNDKKTKKEEEVQQKPLSMSEEDIDTLKEALNEADAKAEEWERKHKELQVLSDQAYDIMNNELSNKDQQLIEMHKEAARMEREALVNAASNNAPSKLDTKLADQAAAFADRQEKRAVQEVTREMETYKAEVEKYQGKVTMLESEREHLCQENKLAKEKVESLTVELDSIRSTSVLPDSGIPGSAKEEELAKEVKRWIRKYNELSDLSDDAYTILSSQLRDRDEVAQELNQSLQQAELEINDFQNTIDRLTAELEESHAAVEAAGRLAEKALHEKHSAHVAALAERERAERAEKQIHGHDIENEGGDEPGGEDEEDKITPLASDGNGTIPPSSPESTNELAASLNKLKAKWNSDDNDEPSSPSKAGGEVDHNSSLFANFKSPLTKQLQQAAQSPEGPPSPAALAAQAAKKHLTALEKELSDCKESEALLRDQLVLARAEIRKLKTVIEEGSGENGMINEDGTINEGGGRGFCGAGNVGVGNDKLIPSGVVEYEVVKENVRRLSQVLMSGDAPSEAVAEYDKWETIMAAHPDYLAERRADLDAFLAKHADRNLAALEATRRFVPPDIWNISFQTFSAGAGNMPEKLIKHIWENKVLWWVRLEPKCIAKVHIADLRSKYIFQNLDLTEMRAVMAVLPDQFENDPNGEKEAWRTNILETIRAGLSSEEKGTLNKEKIRAKLYFEDGMHLQGPYNPNAPLHEFSLTTSDAFAPTPQFQMVSRIDDNVELSNRRSSITGESVVEAKPIKRQVEQLDIQKFADNPEMQRRREAFSKDKIMNNDSSSSLNGSGGYHRSMSMSDIGNQPIGRSSHVTELFTQRSMNDENNNITRPKTQWEIERESLALIMAGRDERTAFDPKANNTMNHNNGNSADWEIELAKAKAYQQQKVIAENNQPPPTRQKNRNSVGVASSGSLLTAGGTLDSHHQVRTTSSRSRRTTRHSTGGKGSSQPWAAARQRQQTIPNGSRGVQNTETRKTMRASDQVPLQRNERIDIVNKYKL